MTSQYHFPHHFSAKKVVDGKFPLKVLGVALFEFIAELSLFTDTLCTWIGTFLALLRLFKHGEEAKALVLLLSILVVVLVRTYFRVKGIVVS